MIDIQTLIEKACVSDTDEDYEAAAYAVGIFQPNYPVPALRITFDYFPSWETDTGNTGLYGQVNNRPDRWFEFLTIE